MVQPVAPTSTCACIVDPIVNSAPCQLISGACSAVRSLAQRIMNFVSSIFTVIANFVRSCFCGASAAAPPAAPVVTTPAAPLVGIVPVLPTVVDVVAEGKTFLAYLVREFENNFEEGELLDLMRNEAAAKAFLASLLVYALVMESESFDGIQLPFMATRVMGSTPTTFISSVEQLRASFAALDPAPEPNGTDDDESGTDSTEEVVTLGGEVRQLFADRHLTNGLQDDNLIHSSSQGIDRDVFDPNPNNANSAANVFYNGLNTLAGRFANPFTNPTFAAAAEAMRTEYILINA